VIAQDGEELGAEDRGERAIERRGRSFGLTRLPQRLGDGAEMRNRIDGLLLARVGARAARPSRSVSPP